MGNYCVVEECENNLSNNVKLESITALGKRESVINFPALTVKFIHLKTCS